MTSIRLGLFACLRPVERIFIAILAVAILVMAAPIAFAQTAADVTPAVDWGFSLVRDVLVPVLLTVATTFIGVLAALLKKKLGVDTTIATAAMNTTLHAAIERGVSAMEAEFRNRLYDESGKVVVSVKNAGIAAVIERTATLMPDTLAELGVTNSTLQRLVAEAVNARIEKAGQLAAGILVPTRELETN